MDKPLTTEELDIIRRLHAGEVPDASYDPYEPMTEWFTGKGKEEIMPLSSAPEPKRRWVPSKWEKQKVCNVIFPVSTPLTLFRLEGDENCSRDSPRPHYRFKTQNHL